MKRPSQSTLNPARHLTEDDLLPEGTQCPICGSPSPVGAKSLALIVQTHPVVGMRVCEQCHAASVTRMPKEAYLNAYYASYYDAFDGMAKVAFWDIRRFAHHIVSGAPAGGRHGHHMHLLDYGGGDGRIAVEVARCMLAAGTAKTIHVDCCDLSGTALAPVVDSAICLRGCRQDQIDPGTYHGVIASAVFEHIPYPRPIMRTLLSSLTDSGWLYTRTPYILPILRAARRIRVQLPMGFPAHLHDLGASFWEGCLAWLDASHTHVLHRSQTSIIETNWRYYPLRTMLAWCLKRPCHWGIRSWPFVGGWEVWIARV